MSRISEWTGEELKEHIRQWEIDSIEDVNKVAGEPLTDIVILSRLVRGLIEDNRFLLGVVSELTKRLL